MPRHDDDEDDDRPRRRPRRDDDEDDAPRSRRRPADDQDEAPPRRRRPRDDDDDRPKKKSSVGLILGIVGGILLLCCGGGGVGLYYFFSRVGGALGDAISQEESSNNLKEIGLGLHNYESRNGSFPTNSFDGNGKPLLSWRVHLLPYVGEQGLYSQFNLNEAWDGPTNKKLLDQMPRVYATPAERHGSVAKGNKTYYRGFSSPGALFAPPANLPKFPGGLPPGMNPSANGLRLTNITDGLSNTVAVVEAGDAVEWSKPDDLDAAPGKPFPKLGGVRPKADLILALMADSSVRTIRRTLPETQWRNAATVADGQVVFLD